MGAETEKLFASSSNLADDLLPERAQFVSSAYSTGDKAVLPVQSLSRLGSDSGRSPADTSDYFQNPALSERCGLFIQRLEHLVRAGVIDPEVASSLRRDVEEARANGSAERLLDGVRSAAGRYAERVNGRLSPSEPVERSQEDRPSARSPLVEKLVEEELGALLEAFDECFGEELPQLRGAFEESFDVRLTEMLKEAQTHLAASSLPRATREIVEHGDTRSTGKWEADGDPDSEARAEAEREEHEHSEMLVHHVEHELSIEEEAESLQELRLLAEAEDRSARAKKIDELRSAIDGQRRIVEGDSIGSERSSEEKKIALAVIAELERQLARLSED